MVFKLSIGMDNAPFDQPDELSRIVENVARQVRDVGYRADGSGVVFDLNGNTVGHWTIERE